MKNYTVRPYNSDDFIIWNDFISRAKNATFLFHRDFMEYHSDRFEDFSLMIFEDEKLISVLPANKKEDTIFSHQGLTYGGFVFEEEKYLFELDSILKVVVNYLKNMNFNFFNIKDFIRYYSEFKLDINDFYTKNNFKNIGFYRNMVISFENDFKISKSKLKHFKRIHKLGLELKQDNNFELFWKKVLEPKLLEKYNTKPLHTLEEIKKLHSIFPENILQYNLYFQDEILAGITIFKNKKVIKSQYGASNSLGMKYRAIDYIFISLIEKFSTSMDYFDMGTVDDDSELGYNIGMYNQKKELGCEEYFQNYYELFL